MSATKPRARSKALAFGTERPARRATLPALRPVDEDGRAAELARRARSAPRPRAAPRTRTSSCWPRADADRERARGAQRQLAAGVADLRVGEVLARPDRAAAGGTGEKPHSSSSRLSSKRSSSVGAPTTAEIRLDARALAGADQDVARRRRCGRSSPRSPRAPSSSSSLIDLDPPRRVDAAQDGAAGVGDLGEGGHPPAGAGSASTRSRGARVVALLVEPDRVGVVGVGEAEGRGVAVHLARRSALPSRRRRRARVWAASLPLRRIRP